MRDLIFKEPMQTEHKEEHKYTRSQTMNLGEGADSIPRIQAKSFDLHKSPSQISLSSTKRNGEQSAYALTFTTQSTRSWHDYIYSSHYDKKTNNSRDILRNLNDIDNPRFNMEIDLTKFNLKPNFGYKWIPIREIQPMNKEVTIFGDAINFSQGFLADCWLIAPLIGIQIIDNEMKEKNDHYTRMAESFFMESPNKEGKYLLRFMIFGEVVRFLIADTIPCGAENNNVLLIYIYIYIIYIYIYSHYSAEQEVLQRGRR